MTEAKDLRRIRARRALQRRAAVASGHGPVGARGAGQAPAAELPVYRLDGQLSPAGMRQIQGSLGNRAVSRHIATGQPIQRLWGRKKKPTDADLKDLKQKAGHNQTTSENDVKKVPEGHNMENAQEGVGFGAELTQVPGDALNNYGGSTTRLDGEELEFTGATGQAALGSAGAGLGAVGSGLTTVGGGIGVVLSVMKLRELAKSTDPGKRWDQFATLSILTGSGAQTLLGGAQTVAGMVGAGGNAAAAAGKETGKTVADASSGVMDSLGALGGLVEMGVSGAQGVAKVAQLVKGKSWDADLASGAAIDFLKSLKGAAMTAKSLVSAANTWMSLAGEAIAILPVVGAAINIVGQMVDVLIQLVTVAMRTYKLVKAAIMAAKMRAVETAKGAGSEVGKFAAGMALNAKKRWKRQIAPLIGNVVTIVADFISIGGSVLNIVGAATAAAYGAGVGVMAAGYAATATAGALKVGAALIKPTQSFVRWSKQRIRDKGQGGTGFHAGAAKFFRVDMDKTTESKNKEIAGQISFLMKHLHGLRDLPAPTDSNYAAIKAEYEEAHLLVKSTGVKVNDLSGASDARAVVTLLAKAMRERE
ncbi:MAG: hypothetical protein ABI577_14715 [bacterium]